MRLRPLYRAAGLLSLGLLTFAAPAQGGDKPVAKAKKTQQSQPAKPAAGATSATNATTATTATARRLLSDAEISALLANPAPSQIEFQFLNERRHWLARQNGRVEAFEQVAAEMEARGAYYPAVEVLWFAEKFNIAPERRQTLSERMKALLDKAAKVEEPVAMALKAYDRGKKKEALAALEKIAREHPFCEKAHYHLAALTYRGFQDADQPGKKNLPLAERKRLFRQCYEGLMRTLAIDPLYNDAWYQLSLIRSILSDDHAFLVKTNVISMRAMAFANDVLKPMEALDGGDRSPETLRQAAEGMQGVGLVNYAIYAYQAALSQGGEGWKDAAAVSQTLSKLLAAKAPAAKK